MNKPSTVVGLSMGKFALVFFLFTYSSASVFAFDHDHQKWTQVLQEYQTAQGLVKYKRLKSDTEKNPQHHFLTYLADLQGVTLQQYNGFTRAQQMAFLINAYNALTVKLIVNHYPVKSIKKIGGWLSKPWSVEFFSLLDGQLKSIDPIEHKWLRPKFKDHRIHAAVNCASISCPPLRNGAFVASQLDQQLDEQMRTWLNDPTRNQLTSTGKVWKISKIFDWYEDDFKNWGGGVVNVINKYLPQPLSRELASEVQLEYLDYDWNLNESK